MLSASATAIASVPSSAALRITCAGATDPGRVRPHNEDRFIVDPGLGLFIVADGMGGAAAGEVAARMAVALVHEAIFDADVTWPEGVTSKSPELPLLIDAIQRANHCIRGAALRNPELKGMGTTIAAVLASGTRVALAHVGDSRVYRLREGRLTQLTEDHSLFNEMVRLGRADPARPEAFDRHHVLTRAVGTHDHVEVEARLVDVVPGDTLLLATDGLCSVVEREEIEGILAAKTEVDEAAEELIAAANRRGGPDNVTVVVARWEPGDVQCAEA